MYSRVLLLVVVLLLPSVLTGCCSDPPPERTVDSRLVEEVGAEFADALFAPDALEILSLHPSWADDPSLDPALRDLPRFRGWPVLGHTDVVAPDEAVQLTGWLAHGIVSNDGRFAKCFVPRHGYRITKNGRTFDVVVCFECLRLQVSVAGGGGEARVILTSANVEPQTTAFFRRKGLEFDEEFDAARKP